MKDTGIQGLTDRGQTGREPELAGGAATATEHKVGA